MDSLTSLPTTSTTVWQRTRAAVLAIALLAFGLLVGLHMGAYAGGSDSSGYLNNARLLREHRVHVPERAIPTLPPQKMPQYAYIPLGFVPVKNDAMVPTYPIGLPMLVLATSWLSGWTAAPHVAMWLHAMAGVVLMFALARQTKLSVGWAAFAALLLAASPLYVFMSVQAMSDVPALVWTTAAVVLAWRSRTKTSSALAAGIAFAIAVMVRPTNLLGIVPVLIALGLNWRRWLLLGLGGLPGAVAVALYNRTAYGDPFSSGYGAVFNIFTFEVVKETLVHYATWLPVLLTPIGVLALGLPWLYRGEQRLWAALLATWIAIFLGVYAFYYHTHEAWWYLRFVLPAFPAMILAAVLIAQRLAAAWVRRYARPWAPPALAVLVVLFVVTWSKQWNRKWDSWNIGHGEGTYRRAVGWALDHLPANTIIATMQTSGALFYYSDLTFVRWDQLQPKDVTAVEQAAADQKRPLVAMLFRFEQDQALNERMPGRWTKLATVEQTTFWRWDGPASKP